MRGCEMPYQEVLGEAVEEEEGRFGRGRGGGKGVDGDGGGDGDGLGDKIWVNGCVGIHWGLKGDGMRIL